MIFGVNPLLNCKDNEIGHRLLTKSKYFIPMTFADFSLQGALFLNKCLVFDPKIRMSVQDMVSDDYLHAMGLEEIKGDRVSKEKNLAEHDSFL